MPHVTLVKFECPECGRLIGALPPFRPTTRILCMCGVRWDCSAATMSSGKPVGAMSSPDRQYQNAEQGELS